MLDKATSLDSRRGHITPQAISSAVGRDDSHAQRPITGHGRVYAVNHRGLCLILVGRDYSGHPTGVLRSQEAAFP